MAAEPVTDKVVKSARGEDKPIDAKRPGVPFSLVLGAYPIALVVALLIGLLVMWFARG